MNKEPSDARLWYVYLHALPNGDVFYVGKGSWRRAHDLAPSTRHPKHDAIVRHYGERNIQVTVFACDSEAEALSAEKRVIAGLLARGQSLVNVTSRRPRRENGLPGLPRVMRPRIARPAVCAHCGTSFQTKSAAKGVYCKDSCRQKARKRRLTANGTVGCWSTNSSGVTGVNWHASSGRWQAQIVVCGKRHGLGYHRSFDDAVAARKAAEVRLAQPVKSDGSELLQKESV